MLGARLAAAWRDVDEARAMMRFWNAEQASRREMREAARL